MAKSAKQRTAEWRQRHPEKNRQVWMNSNRKSRDKYMEMKRDIVVSKNGCQICGYNDFSCLAVYDFHHTDNNKEINLSQFRKLSNKDGFTNEADKCIVVCSNCHRRTHNIVITNIC